MNRENKPVDAENFSDAEMDFADETHPAEEEDTEGGYDEEGPGEEVSRLKKSLQEQQEKYLRLVAEFDNFRKRNSRERLELIQTANKDVILALLDILDDIDRATAQIGEVDDIKALKEGELLIFNKLKTRLQSLGLKEMDSLHTDFDAELHDAITEIPAPSAELKGKVVDNIQKGYYLNDKLIRHAKVVVGK